MRIRPSSLFLCAFALLQLACAKDFPNIELNGPNGEETDIASIGADSDYTVLVILLGNCPMTEMGARILKDFHETNPPYTRVAGILIDANSERARRYQLDNELPYPIYGMDRRRDPLAWNDMISNVGSRRRAIFGGTIVVLDPNLKVRYSADGEKLRDVPDRLMRLVN